MKKFLLLCGIVLAFSLHAAEQKIAVVNMEKVFRTFYKTKIAELALQNQQEIYVAHLNTLNNSYTKLEEEYNLLRDGSLNLALSPTERESKRLEAQKKYQDLQAKRLEIQGYAETKQREFTELERQKNDEIISEIRKEVQRRATLEGFSFVLDCSGKNSNYVTAVIYFDPTYDISEKIIEELNRGNQPTTTDASPQSEEAKK